jgi:hypothetical protein
MQELFRLFPLPLLVLTVILIFAPTAIAVFARIVMHQHLRDQVTKVSRLLTLGENRGLQPRILENLENRYKVASYQLENVNTVALISSAYGEEKISLLGFNVRCDKAENFCRILPNLLLTFGLLGTFVGITSNLYNIGEAINSVSQNGADISALVKQLLPQLQGMGVAFLASLTALLCSSILTIINFAFNTGWAKYQLIGCLEDYLDNIYKSSVEGDTRLDKAVNRMVEQQQEFLTRFHEKVGQVLEDTFGRAAKQIADESSKANKLAEQVYTQFSQSAGTIFTGATVFKQSAQSLEVQTQIIAKLIPQFRSSAEQIHLGTSRFLSASEKIEQSNAIVNLEKIAVDLCTTQKAFTQSTETLETGLQGIMGSNLQAAQLAEQVYSQLQNSTAQIQQGSEGFLTAANLIQDCSLAEQLDASAEKWLLAQQEFTDSTLIFSETSQALEPMISTLNSSGEILGNLGDQILQLSQNSLQVTEANQQNIASREQQFLSAQQNSEQTLRTLNQSITQFESGLKQLHENWATKAAEQMMTHKDQNSQLIITVGQHIEQISENQKLLNNLIQTVTKANSNLQSLDKTWSISSQNQLNSQQQQHDQILKKMGDHISQIIENNQITFNKLLNTTSTLDKNFGLHLLDLSNNLSSSNEKMIEQLSLLLNQQSQRSPITTVSNELDSLSAMKE